MSGKSKETKNEAEPTRRSGRSVAKNDVASPESDKSPSEKSRQSTPSSTPRKSITPSPRSKAKNETESTSASENDKTPQKRVSSRSKRSLNLNSDEETSPPSATKRQQRKSKITSKATTAQSSDEDHVSEEEDVSQSAKKSRTSKSKGGTKNTKNSTAKSPAGDVQSDQSVSDSEDDAVDKSKSKKSRRGGNSKAMTNKLDKMKRLLVYANLKVSHYGRFFKDCGTDREKVDFVVNYLREKGLKGEPTIENCKKLGKKIAKEKEVAQLDKNNIIDSSPSTSGSRVTRSRRSASRRS